MSKIPVIPTLDAPLSDAVEEITGFETLVIQRHYGKKFEELGAIELTIALVWTYENRDSKKRSWSSVENMTFRELTGYFAPEPEDVDESEPDSAAGKDALSAEPQTVS